MYISMHSVSTRFLLSPLGSHVRLSGVYMLYSIISGAVTSLDISNDERTLVSGSKDRSIGIWDITRTS